MNMNNTITGNNPKLITVNNSLSRVPLEKLTTV
jgi:hypothetical protein